MTEVVIDTHAYFKRLTGAGMSEPLAEVVAHERAQHIESLVTKDDLKSEMQLLEHRLTIKFGTMFVAGHLASIGIILALLPMVLK